MPHTRHFFPLILVAAVLVSVSSTGARPVVFTDLGAIHIPSGSLQRAGEPEDCVGAWEPLSAWSLCENSVQRRTEIFVVTTPASLDGVPCAYEDGSTRTVTRSCEVPTPVSPTTWGMLKARY
jgi:hypothetical protein